MEKSGKTKRVYIRAKLNTWQRSMVLTSLEDKLEAWQGSQVDAYAINNLRMLIDALESNDIYLD